MKKFKTDRKNSIVSVTAAILTTMLLMANRTSFAQTPTPTNTPTILGVAEGYVGFLDHNNMNEPTPLADETVWLLSEDNGTLCKTTTNADGIYRFTDLELGTYTVTFDDSSLPSGLPHAPAYVYDNGDDSSATFMLTADAPTLDVLHFIYSRPTLSSTRSRTDGISAGKSECVPSASILGSVDGFVGTVENTGGNAPLDNITVWLFNEDNGTTCTTTTDADGTYQFTDLELGVYTVTIDNTLFPQDVAIVPAFSPDNGDDSSSTVTLTIYEPVNDFQDFVYAYYTSRSVVAMKTHNKGRSETSNECVPMEPTPGMVSGHIETRDDSQDPIEELPVPNVTVQLFDENGVFVDETTTNAEGEYQFSELALGNYTAAIVTTTLPAEDGFLIPYRSPDSGDDHRFSLTLTVRNPTTTRENFEYDISPFSVVVDGLVAIIAPAFDLGDATYGTADITVRLFDENQTLIDETMTDASGVYSFTIAEVGRYTVELDRLSLPQPHQSSSPWYSPDGGTDLVHTFDLNHRSDGGLIQEWIFDDSVIENAIPTAITLSTHTVNRLSSLVFLMMIPLGLITTIYRRRILFGE